MRRSSRACVVTLAAIVGLAFGASVLHAQPPAVAERVTFDDAIKRAIDKNPTMAMATAGIVRAEGLLRQARAATLLQLNGAVTTTTLDRSVDFGGSVVTPRNQVTASITADMPIVNAAAWARRAQAQDQRAVAEFNLADVRRQVASSTADAYLAIVAARRVVDANVLAREVAKAHFDLATQLEQRGTGSRVNTLRAQQQVSADEVLIEAARLALYRAQEALGVLVVADGPVDAADEPTFEMGAAAAESTGSPAGAPGPQPTNVQPSIGQRTDLRLFTAQQQAAERVVRDSWRDYLPSFDALFVPQTIYPSPFFLPSKSWQFQVQARIPVFDSGERAGLKVQRQSDLDVAAATLASATTAANSQVRAAREAIASGVRGLASARAAAEEGRQVVDILTISFRAGAATSIEVLDADRSARNADIAVAVAEDALRRARLDLLIALGRFPQ
jgi:outer membrane protein